MGHGPLVPSRNRDPKKNLKKKKRKNAGLVGATRFTDSSSGTEEEGQCSSSIFTFHRAWRTKSARTYSIQRRKTERIGRKPAGRFLVIQQVAIRERESERASTARGRPPSRFSLFFAINRERKKRFTADVRERRWNEAYSV